MPLPPQLKAAARLDRGASVARSCGATSATELATLLPIDRPPSFQDLILRLQRYWAEQGCVILQPYDIEVGAGTFHPATTLRALGPEPWNAAYVQPSRRPTDGRYGENPNRLQHYYQFQVILKPSPPDLQELYLRASTRSASIPRCTTSASSRTTGRARRSAPGASAGRCGATAWRSRQFTYFQQVGGFDCQPVSGELTYGLERLAMYVQGVENVYDLDFNGQGVTYGDVFLQNEQEFSEYNFEVADTELLFRHFAEAEKRVPSAPRPRALPLPAYDQCLKASHLFNLLDARGVISVTERAAYIGRVRALAKGCCRGLARTREAACRMADFLLELLSEEIPARMQARARNDLARALCGVPRRGWLGVDAIARYSTPRRLVLIADGFRHGSDPGRAKGPARRRRLRR